MIMAGMKPKNIIRKYSKESLKKLRNNAGTKLRIMNILKNYKKNMQRKR